MVLGLSWEKLQGYRKVRFDEVLAKFPLVDSWKNLQLISQNNATTNFFSGYNKIAMTGKMLYSILANSEGPEPHIKISNVTLETHDNHWKYFIPNKFGSIFKDYNDFLQEINRYLKLKLKVSEAMGNYYEEVRGYNIKFYKSRKDEYFVDKEKFIEIQGYRFTRLKKLMERERQELEEFKNYFWWVKIKKMTLIFQSVDLFNEVHFIHEKDNKGLWAHEDDSKPSYITFKLAPGQL